LPIVTTFGRHSGAALTSSEIATSAAAAATPKSGLLMKHQVDARIYQSNLIIYLDGRLVFI
jgi:hypothetical protein